MKSNIIVPLIVFSFLNHLYIESLGRVEIFCGKLGPSNKKIMDRLYALYKEIQGESNLTNIPNINIYHRRSQEFHDRMYEKENHQRISIPGPSQNSS